MILIIDRKRMKPEADLVGTLSYYALRTVALLMFKVR